MKSTNTIWILVAGLAVGFLIGREMPRRGGGSSDDTTTASTGDKPRPATAGNKGGGTVAGPTEIPADWIKEDGLNAAADFADLTPAQRYLTLKVMNEKPCDCGCPHGNTAKCKKED